MSADPQDSIFSEHGRESRHIAEAISRVAAGLERLAGSIESKQCHALIERLAQMEDHIMATLAEQQAALTADLKLANDQLRKIITDSAGVQPAMDALTAKIVDLEALIAAGGTIGQELIDTVAETKALASAVDEGIPELPAARQ